jgi:hypothetical protein
MRCVVGTQALPRPHDGGASASPRAARARARARHILHFYSHTPVPVTCTRSAASSPPPSAHRRADGTSGGSCGCRVPRATGGAPRRAGGCCGGLDLENVEGGEGLPEGGLTTRKRFFVTKTKHRFSTYLSARASSLDALAGSCHPCGPRSRVSFCAVGQPTRMLALSLSNHPPPPRRSPPQESPPPRADHRASA